MKQRLLPLRLHLLFAVIAFAALPTSAQAPSDPRPKTVSYEAALSLAIENAPLTRIGKADVALADARLLTGGTYPYNPEIEFEPARRRGPDKSTTDLRVELSQEFEIGGQRRNRVAMGEAGVEASSYGYLRTREVVVARAGVAFVEALRSRQNLRVAEVDRELTAELLRYARRRLDAGAGNQIDVNLASSAAGRSARALRVAQADFEQSRAYLAEVIGLGETAQAQPEGELPWPDFVLPSMEEAIQTALSSRTDLQSLKKLVEVSTAEARLLKSLVVPNLRVGAFYEQEAALDDIQGIRLGVSIPIFNRYRGPIAEVRAISSSLGAQVEELELAIRQEVVSAFSAYRASALAAGELDELVVGTLEENLGLVQRAFEEGKLSSTDSLLTRRELVGAQRELISALADSWIARIDFELATGQIEIPETASMEDAQ